MIGGRLKGPRYAYILQFPLPGKPIKFGLSAQPLESTLRYLWAPAKYEIIGATREEYLPRIRESVHSPSMDKFGVVPTERLQKTISEIYLINEWFVLSGDIETHYKDAAVVDRLLGLAKQGELGPYIDAERGFPYPSIITHGSIRKLLAANINHEPFLGLELAGFERSKFPPFLAFN